MRRHGIHTCNDMYTSVLHNCNNYCEIILYNQQNGIALLYTHGVSQSGWMSLNTQNDTVTYVQNYYLLC